MDDSTSELEDNMECTANGDRIEEYTLKTFPERANNEDCSAREERHMEQCASPDTDSNLLELQSNDEYVRGKFLNHCGSEIDNINNLTSTVNVDSKTENNSAHLDDNRDRTSRNTCSNRPSKNNKRRSGGKKHRAGRNQNKKWKPYSKMTWSERKQLDERKYRRTLRQREHMLSSGMPLAPLNTTQFIVDDRKGLEPYKIHGDFSFDDFLGNTPRFDNFDDMWDVISLKYLQDLSKEQLVSRYISLEDKIAEVERQLKEIRDRNKILLRDVLTQGAEFTKVQIFQEEIRKLEAENAELSQINSQIQLNLSSESFELEKNVAFDEEPQPPNYQVQDLGICSTAELILFFSQRNYGCKLGKPGLFRNNKFSN